MSLNDDPTGTREQPPTELPLESVCLVCGAVAICEPCCQCLSCVGPKERDPGCTAACEAAPRYCVTQIGCGTGTVAVEVLADGRRELRQVPLRRTGWYVTDRETGKDYGPYDHVEAALEAERALRACRYAREGGRVSADATTTTRTRSPGRQGACMKRYAIVYLAGALSAGALALSAGGERLTQLGLRLTAAEQHYQWEARAATAEASRHAPLRTVRR